MEFFTKAKVVRLRSHIDKYLFADEDEEKVRQSRQGSSRNVKWEVELVEGYNHVIRLKSRYGRYLTASDEAYLTGLTGKKVIQTAPTANLDSLVINWEPIRDGFQVKLRTCSGKFLRANGGTPPWRNSVTHDVPNRTSTQYWVYWDVDILDIQELLQDNDNDSFASSQLRLSNCSSLSEDPIDSPKSPWSSMASFKSSIGISSLSKASPAKSSPKTIMPASPSPKLGMELFQNAKAVRLKSHHDKYLVAEEDEESVTQDRNGSSKAARWNVEFVDGGFIRLKSCHGKYLTASNVPFLLGMTGRKVLQSLPRRLDSSLEWEPIRDGFQVKLKTRYGNFLRANGGVPPWRNSVTHDVPQRTKTQDWILWDVDILEIQVQSPVAKKKVEKVEETGDVSPSVHPLPSEPSSPTKSPKFTKQESSDSLVSSSFKVDGRTIYYHIADENGDYDDGFEGYSFTFKGKSVEELTQKFEEETGLEDLIVCTKSALNDKLYPLRLNLPPNNATMHVVLVEASSKAARNFAKPGLL